MKTYYQITCELYTEHVVPVINAKQYDSGRGVDITLTDCGAVVVPAVSDVCNLYCKKSDGTVSYISGTVNGSAVRVDFTNTLLAEAGVVECELEVTSGADTVSTPVFRMVVLPSNYDPIAIESQDEFTALETALQTVSSYDGRIGAIEGAIADQSTANQTDSTVETLVASIISDATEYGIHTLGGSWKNHAGGYNGYVVKRKYDNTTDAWEGQITASAGGAWAFNKTGSNATYITAIDSADAVRLYTGAAGLWMGKLSTANSLGFYSAAYPSGANLLGTISLGLGTIISDTLTTATSCGNSDFLNAASVAHEAGTYVVVGYVSFASNASGVRSMLITSSSTGSSAIVTSARARVAPVTGYETTLGCAGIIKATAAGTWYLRAWQNSGAALNVTGAQLTAIKIAD